MDDIRRTIENRNYEKLIELCETLEFENAAYTTPDLPQSTIYATLLGAYLIVNDLNSARFLRKRILQCYKGEANSPEELNAVWGVGAALWMRSFEKAYSVLDSYAWSADIRPLMAILRETIQDRAYQLISKSFSYIKVTSAADMLGIPQDTILDALTKKGWLLDNESQLLKPAPILTAPQEKVSLAQLSRLEDIVVYLESS
ncbi:COP9 signalosome [Umbelopsis sp. PMI_123]|nr:COP9 signalosome [Umbelopsis sp. PMI_123]